MTQQRIVLSGASGFIGSHLHSALLRQGVDLCLLTHQRSPQVRGVGGFSREVSVMTSDWMKHIDDFAPTCVIHAATRFQVTHDCADTAPMVRANVEVGTQLLDLASRHKSRFVTLSTAWQQYGGKSGNPVNLYAATKQAFDSIADFYCNEGLNLRRLFLFDVYGVGDTRKKLVPLLFRAARTGKPMRATSGKQLIDLTYVEDVVEAVMANAVGQLSETNGDAVLKSGVRSVRSVADCLENAIGCPVPVVWGAFPDRPKEMRQDWGLKPILRGWQPKVELSEGFRRIWHREAIV